MVVYPTDYSGDMMNKTFKIVFNKARGTLMVANEMTSSVQKKGVSLVAATAAVLTLLTAPSVNAEDITKQEISNHTSQTTGGALTLEKDDSNSISHSSFTGNKAKEKGGAVVIKKNTSVSDSTFNSNSQTSASDKTAGGGAVFIEGATVGISSSHFTNNTGFRGGAVNVYAGSTLSVTNSNFSKNHAYKSGGAISDYIEVEGKTNKNSDISINSSVFESNQSEDGGGALHVVNTESVDIKNSQFRGNYSAGKGGAIQIENGVKLTATDTVFSGNTTDYWGGAIRILGADVTISSTEDLAMTGNKANVQGLMSAYYNDMGGFAYLQGNSTLTLAAENGSTLTIGDAKETDKTIDSIASSGDLTNELILKGKVVINSSLEAFSDKITVADNADVTMATGFASNHIASWSTKTSELSLGKNASLSMGDLLINRASSTPSTPGVSISAEEKSALTLASLTLDQGKKNAGYGEFNLTDASVNVAGDVALKTADSRLDIKGSGNFNVNGTLTVAGKMTAAGTTGNSLQLSTNALSIDEGGSLAIGANATLAAPLKVVFTGNPTIESTSLTLLKGLSFDKDSSLCITDKGIYNIAFMGTLKTASKAGSVSLPNATLAMDTGTKAHEFTDNTTVGALDAKDTSVTVSKTLTIGNPDASSSAAAPSPSSVKSIKLSSSDNSAARLAVTGLSTVKVETLEGKGNVVIGSTTGSGLGASMNIGKLAMDGGTIFIDPLYGHSVLTATEVADNALKVQVIAGSGSLVTIGATEAASSAAVEKLGLSDRSAIVYTAQSLDLADGGINIADGLTESNGAAGNGQVKVGSEGALIVDQAAVGSKVFTNASVTFSDDGKLGIVNATAGALTLADSVSGLTANNVVTDNPFIDVDSVTNTGVMTKVSATGGLGALASTGIQAMTRRADSVLAQTIADRTSVDQDYASGTSLWVDVTGERYEADKLENNGSFKSDMGYGAFGADFAVTDDVTAGAAFQYGKGTLRSSVSSIKNSIDSYGITAYGAMKFGDAKIVAEAAYVKNENDVTSSQTALSQKVDSDIYSLGIRGQHRFTAGNFQFVPSMGVRVSRLNTDSMKVGAVNIKKQEQTLVQVPIALRVNGFEQNAAGWSVAPSFKVAYVPTFGDKEISVLGFDQTVIDTSPVQGDFGIRAQKGNLMVNASFMVGGGKDGTSSVGGKAGLKYVF